VPGIDLRVVPVAGPAGRPKGTGRLRLAARTGTRVHTVKVTTGSATVSEVLRFLGIPAGRGADGAATRPDASGHELDE
jgi:hypothetical protein